MRWYFVAVLWGLQLLDIVSTRAVLAMGGTEANPIMVSVIHTNWGVIIKLVIMPAVLIWLMYLSGSKGHWVAGLTLVYFVVVASNTLQILAAVT